MIKKSTEALKIWYEKREFLERELALTADYSEEFRLRKQIQDINCEIYRLETPSGDPKIGMPVEIGHLCTLERFAPGPGVKQQYLPDRLIHAFADMYSSESLASSIINQANAARLKAAPEVAPESSIVINKNFLPDIGVVGSFGYWNKVFVEAFRHGPRMVAALLQTTPEELLGKTSRAERTHLIDLLFSMSTRRITR